jgi:hypothetical protein
MARAVLSAVVETGGLESCQNLEKGSLRGSAELHFISHQQASRARRNGQGLIECAGRAQRRRRFGPRAGIAGSGRSGRIREMSVTLERFREGIELEDG